MIVNEKKHQALILGKTEHNFCFPVNNSIDIFRMKIDDRFSFDNHEFKFQVFTDALYPQPIYQQLRFSSSLSVAPISIAPYWWPLYLQLPIRNSVSVAPYQYLRINSSLSVAQCQQLSIRISLSVAPLSVALISVALFWQHCISSSSPLATQYQPRNSGSSLVARYQQVLYQQLRITSSLAPVSEALYHKLRARSFV